MRDITNVLAATDFSPWAEVATHAAGMAAELYDAKLIAAHIMQNMDKTYALLVENLDDFNQKEQQEAERNIGELLDDLNLSRSHSRAVVSRGSAVEGLIQLALQEHTDLVVAGMMGATSQNTDGQLGSVVERLVLCGLFDLLLVRHDQPETITNVGAATDFSQLADIAIERAIDVVQRRGGDKVTVIHAYQWPVGYSKLGICEGEREDHCLAAIQRQFDELRERVPEPEGITYVPAFVRGSPEDAVREACAEHNLDMLTIGAAGRTAAAVALIGNVAMKIIRNAPCSVWVTRPAGYRLTFKDAIYRLMGLED
jgi:nucleotide-binding universal stress UspA family protein